MQQIPIIFKKVDIPPPPSHPTLGNLSKRDGNGGTATAGRQRRDGNGGTATAGRQRRDGNAMITAKTIWLNKLL